MKFEETGLSQQAVTAIKKLGFETATKIQEKSIPHIVDGIDVIGESATGSGKTLAFACGVLESVKPNQGLQSLILTPTRELAEQVKDEVKKICNQIPLKIMPVYGGVAIGPQIQQLKSANVVIGTPGRILDHLQRRTINLSKVKLFILDEVDRMFDMGFIEDVERIISQIPQHRQTLFFSATISEKIRRLANSFMINPVVVSAGNRVDPSKLKQVYYNVDKNAKLSLLVHKLEKDKSGLVMVFCNTRRTVDFVVKNLKSNDVKAMGIHGGFSQNKRTKSLDDFNSGKVDVLVCTDVAARGLHIDNVSHVYNYEIPKDPTDYVHRIGRTARAGEDGEVINVLSEYDYDNFSRVLNEHRDFKIEKLEVPELKRVFPVKVEHDRNSGRSGGFRRGGNFRKGNFRQGGNGGGYRGGNNFRGGNFSRGNDSRGGNGFRRSNDSSRDDNSSRGSDFRSSNGQSNNQRNDFRRSNDSNREGNSNGGNNFRSNNDRGNSRGNDFKGGNDSNRGNHNSGRNRFKKRDGPKRFNKSRD